MIDEILKLPEEEQVAIMEAIQDNLDDFDNSEKLSEEHIAFIKERIESIERSGQKEHSWEEVKQQLKNRWDSR